jgi:hypothetical protein
MTEADRLAIEHLLTAAEDSASFMASILRTMETSRQLLIHRNACELHRELAALDIGALMGQALVVSQRQEQLFAKLRDVLPSIDEIDTADFWKG